MSEIKVSLSIVLPGRTMLSQESAEALEKSKSASGYDTTKIQVNEYDKKKKKINPEWITVKTRKSIPSKQSLNICKDAYTYMTSSECPSWSKPKEWARLSKKARLESHLEKICESLGGTSYSYVILED